MAYVYYMDPGNRIRELRLQAGLSQAELGMRVGMHQVHVSKIENGTRTLSVEWMKRFAKALGATPADLLTDNDNPDRLGEAERQLIGAYRAADDTTRLHMLRMALALSEPFSNGNGGTHEGVRAA